MPKNTPEQLREVIINVFQTKDIVLAFSTGTPGPFRKITAMIMDSAGNVLGFAKIGETQLAIQRIKHEASVLKLLFATYNLSPITNNYSLISHQPSAISVKFPACLYEGEIDNAYLMIQSPAPFEGKSGKIEFDENYAEILQTLMNNTSVKKKFNESDFYESLREGIDNYSLSYKDILRKGLNYLDEAVGDREITFTLSHGDFAPWNMIWKGKEIFIYDWESANLEAPSGIDIVHFLFQTGFLLTKLRGDKLLRYILQSLTNQRLSKSLPIPLPDILVLLYFLHMAVTEDQPQQLSSTAVERRNLIIALAQNSKSCN